MFVMRLYRVFGDPAHGSRAQLYMGAAEQIVHQPVVKLSQLVNKYLISATSMHSIRERYKK